MEKHDNVRQDDRQTAGTSMVFFAKSDHGDDDDNQQHTTLTQFDKDGGQEITEPIKRIEFNFNLLLNHNKVVIIIICVCGDKLRVYI